MYTPGSDPSLLLQSAPGGPLKTHKSQALTSIPRTRRSPSRIRWISPSGRRRSDSIYTRIRSRRSACFETQDSIIGTIYIVACAVYVADMVYDVVAGFCPHGEVFYGDVLRGDEIAGEEVEDWSLRAVCDAAWYVSIVR